MLVRKARVVPFECVVRGYLSGSGWKEYRSSGTVCGITLPSGLVESERIEPIFTPATKAETGHDENVSFEIDGRRGRQGGRRDVTIDEPGGLPDRRRRMPLGRGLILADTKFEWGFDDETGELLLGRRGAHARQLAVLVERFVSAGRAAAVVRQAVRPRLARDDRLGQGEPAAAIARGRRARRRATSTSRRIEKLTGQAFPWK